MIALGIDTHKHTHVAVALDHLGQVLGELTIDAGCAGYDQLMTPWMTRCMPVYPGAPRPDTFPCSSSWVEF